MLWLHDVHELLSNKSGAAEAGQTGKGGKQGHAKSTNPSANSKGKGNKDAAADNKRSKGKSQSKGKGKGKGGADADRYKKDLCKAFSSKKGCQFGSKCKFAHGATDLITSDSIHATTGSDASPRKSRLQPTDFELLGQIVSHIIKSTDQTGAILIFVPGLAEIKRVGSLLSAECSVLCVTFSTRSAP